MDLPFQNPALFSRLKRLILSCEYKLLRYNYFADLGCNLTICAFFHYSTLCIDPKNLNIHFSFDHKKIAEKYILLFRPCYPALGLVMTDTLYACNAAQPYSQLYETSLMRQVQPDPLLNKGKLFIKLAKIVHVKIWEICYLAPRHQPNSLFLIFFAILTSRSIGISYPV